MRKAQLPLLILTLLLSIGCAPSIKRMHYRSDIATGRTGSPDCDMRIEEQDGPARSGTLLGTMKIDDSGVSTNCHKRVAMKILREEACRIGADVIVLYNVREPDSRSDCYRVTADFVRQEEGEEYNGTAADTGNGTGNADHDAPVLPDGDDELPEPAAGKTPGTFEEMRPCLSWGCSMLLVILGIILFTPKF